MENLAVQTSLNTCKIVPFIQNMLKRKWLVYFLTLYKNVFCCELQKAPAAWLQLSPITHNPSVKHVEPAATSTEPYDRRASLVSLFLSITKANSYKNTLFLPAYQQEPLTWGGKALFYFTIYIIMPQTLEMCVE